MSAFESFLVPIPILSSELSIPFQDCMFFSSWILKDIAALEGLVHIQGMIDACGQLFSKLRGCLLPRTTIHFFSW